jgi:hypothetical protein
MSATYACPQCQFKITTMQVYYTLPSVITCPVCKLTFKPKDAEDPDSPGPRHTVS